MKKRVAKRWMAVALGTTLVVSMAAGCGKGSSSSEEQEGVKTIEWWTPNWDEVESKEMAAEFEKEHPDIKVDIVVTDWDTYKSKITTAISTDNAPEICTMLLTDVAPFANKGLLEPMDELGKQLELILQILWNRHWILRLWMEKYMEFLSDMMVLEFTTI